MVIVQHNYVVDVIMIVVSCYPGVLCGWQSDAGGSATVSPLVDATKLISVQGLDYRSLIIIATLASVHALCMLCE